MKSASTATSFSWVLMGRAHEMSRTISCEWRSVPDSDRVAMPAMLISHRETVMPSLGARLETHALVHSAYRIHAVLRRNVVSEDALLLRGFHRGT